MINIYECFNFLFNSQFYIILKYALYHILSFFHKLMILFSGIFLCIFETYFFYIFWCAPQEIDNFSILSNIRSFTSGPHMLPLAPVQAVITGEFQNRNIYLIFNKPL